MDGNTWVRMAIGEPGEMSDNNSICGEVKGRVLRGARGGARLILALEISLDEQK